MATEQLNPSPQQQALPEALPGTPPEAPAEAQPEASPETRQPPQNAHEAEAGERETREETAREETSSGATHPDATHPGATRLAALEGQLRALVGAGADLRGMFDDPVAAARIDTGEWDVATAYAYWRGREAEAPVLSARGVAAAPAPNFRRMSSEDFAAFCERVDRALAGVERVPL
ncbi:MAG TPA: hypothetical protein IAB73_06010 [Candidatus Onthenecus intestinigallinarum]|uniref:Uncharacterized protein n=1 Tax=Candidatus Onthenecus intestinigallinarum TaxID=2840875 RepID=A0A9D0ZBY0_9FIRM|nr:hypothetical protein [Candidatus Onthenecus intestinigallinarum]